MKKLFALMLALAMCLSLAACGGGVDKQPVIDAFNATTTGFDALAQKINANPDIVDAELAQDLADMSELLGEYKALLESDQELTQESADDMIAWFGTVDALVEEINGEIDAALAAGGEETGITDEQIATLTEVYNEIAPLYNEVYAAAEKNGWLADEQTAVELDAVAGVMNVVGTALTEDLSMLEDADVDALPEALLQFVPELEKMAEKFAAPYAKAE